MDLIGSYEGQKGKPVMVRVYAGGDSAELIRNGNSLGVQPCGTCDAENLRKRRKRHG